MCDIYCIALVLNPVLSPGLPEDFLGSQTLKVSAHRVQALKRCLHTQRTKHILWAQPVKVKGDSSDVFSGPWFVLRFVYNCTLDDDRQLSFTLIMYMIHYRAAAAGQDTFPKLNLALWRYNNNDCFACSTSRTARGLHVCPGSRAMSAVLSGRVMRNSSESTSVPSSSQTRDRDTADRDSSNAWHTCSTVQRSLGL